MKKWKARAKPIIGEGFEIRVNQGRVIVKLDGEQILDYRSDPPSRGNLIGLQLNSGRVEFRNIKVRKLR